MSDETARPRKAPPQLADYPHRVTELVRYGDLDPQGHANNAVFATYLESGRVAMFRDPDLGIGVANATLVLVRQEIDFLRELRWPDDIVVATGVSEFGRTSFVMMQAIFRSEQCAASGRAIMVMLDKETRRPLPLTEALIARLSPWRYRGG